MEDELNGSIAKLLSDEEKNSLVKELNLEYNDILFIVSGKKNIVKTSLGALRLKLGHDLNLSNQNDYKLFDLQLHDLFPEHVQTKTFWFCPHQIMSLYLYSL